MSPKNKVFWIAVVIAFGLDQWSKTWVASSLVYADRVSLIDGLFYITHVRNPGMAFSLLADAPVWLRRTLFIGAGSLALLLVFSFLRQLRPDERFPALALGLILGGAGGNLFDRIFRDGEVVDWIHVRLWSGYSWPDFNVADSAIVVGVSLLVLELLASEGESRASADDDAVDADPADPRGTKPEQA